jgi:hypothetical protein
MSLIPHHSQLNKKKRPKFQKPHKSLGILKTVAQMYRLSPANSSPSTSPYLIPSTSSKISLSIVMSVESHIKNPFEVIDPSELPLSKALAIVRFILQKREVGYPTS